VLVQHGPMPQTRRRLDLATLSLGCQRLVWGSGVVGIGLCTRELYWDPLTRTIASRPPVGGHSSVRRGLAGMLLVLHTATPSSHCARVLSSLSCVFVLSGRVCCLWYRCAVGNAYNSARNACSVPLHSLEHAACCKLHRNREIVVD